MVRFKLAAIDGVRISICMVLYFSLEWIQIWEFVRPLENANITDSENLSSILSWRTSIIIKYEMTELRNVKETS